MAESNSFQELIRRVRAGDDQAAEELVQRYEPSIRLAIRARLTDPGLRRLVDTADICQSVLGSFFVRAAHGQYFLEKEGQLVKLLVSIAENKFLKQLERHRARRRDIRKTRSASDAPTQFVDQEPSPSSQVSLQELLREFHTRLTPEERAIVDLRIEGKSWHEVATIVGGNADGVRMRFVRTTHRITKALGL